jgi:hypothetical protein
MSPDCAKLEEREKERPGSAGATRYRASELSCGVRRLSIEIVVVEIVVVTSPLDSSSRHMSVA